MNEDKATEDFGFLTRMFQEVDLALYDAELKVQAFKRGSRRWLPERGVAS